MKCSVNVSVILEKDCGHLFLIPGMPWLLSYLHNVNFSPTIKVLSYMVWTIQGVFRSTCIIFIRCITLSIATIGVMPAFSPVIAVSHAPHCTAG